MNNAILYNAVLGGTLGAAQILRDSISPATSYGQLIDRATILGVAVDNLYPPSTYRENDGGAMEQIVTRCLLERSLLGATPDYQAIARDIKASFDAYIAAAIPYPVNTGDTLWNPANQTLWVWSGVDWVKTIPAGYTDVFFNVDQAAAVGALTKEAYRDTPQLFDWFRRDQDDTLSLKAQMPHQWDLGGVEPHAHLTPAAPTDGTIVLSGRLAWSHLGTLALPVWADWTPFSVAVPVLGVNQWLPMAISLGTFIPPVTARYPSAILHLYLQRRGASDPADTYNGNKPDHTAAANVGLEFVDAHVRMNGFGTTGLYS